MHGWLFIAQRRVVPTLLEQLVEKNTVNSPACAFWRCAISSTNAMSVPGKKAKIEYFVGRGENVIDGILRAVDYLDVLRDQIIRAAEVRVATTAGRTAWLPHRLALFDRQPVGGGQRPQLRYRRGEVAGCITVSLNDESRSARLPRQHAFDRRQRRKPVLRELDFGVARIAAQHHDSRVIVLDHVLRLLTAAVGDAQRLQLGQIVLAYEPALARADCL